MNLAEALNTSLAELPAVGRSSRYPLLHPKVVVREHKDPDGTYFVGMGSHRRSKIIYLSPQKWDLLQLCNGRRSYEQLAQLMTSRGVPATADVVQTFVEELDQWGFFYQTPQEESVTLAEKLAQQRRSRTRRKSKFDLYKMEVVSWDPDEWMSKLVAWVPWIYSRWFTALTVCGFLFMGYMWLSNWGLFWGDSVSYWNFTDKGGFDLLQFYVIFAVIAFIHECGHGITAKHFGAGVHRLGFMLVYTTPSAFVDTGQVWLYHGRRERCITIMAGLWVEMIVCVIATFIWWGTAPGSFAHDFAYKVVLIGGILPLMINLNPLMRLDGYLFLSELIRTPALKEKSFGFFSAWVRHNIFRLPVTVPSYPRRRQIWYAAYAIGAGTYSYLVLLFLSRITYKIVYNFSPEWAFVPATYVAFRVFKSRLVTFKNFCRTLYLDKKELMLRHRKFLLAAPVALVIFLLVPIWHETAEADFLLEPAQRALVRTVAPGRVTQVLAAEGQTVQRGAALVSLASLRIDSESAQAMANLRQANASQVRAQLQYAELGAAIAERRSAAEQASVATDKQTSMTLRAPISGVIVTPRLNDYADSYLAGGITVVEIDDVSRLRARVFVPEADARVLAHATGAALRVPSQIAPVDGTVVEVSPTEQQIAPGLTGATNIKGFEAGPHYTALLEVANDGRLKPGMSGTAKIFGRRRSAFGLLLQPALDFIGRKIW